MRTWGRDPSNGNVWTEVSTDPNGSNDYVYVTTLAQTLKLNLGESPFYGDYGIPAQPSVVQQVFPDFFVARTQQQFAPFFASLILSKIAATYPAYRMNITLNDGTKLSGSVPI